MKLDHIGYLTDSIEKTQDAFSTIGYAGRGVIVNDDTQKTRISFIYKSGVTPIELVQPYEDNHAMQKMLIKHGNGPYHLCYIVEDIEKEYETMISNNWLPLFKPVAAPALGNRLICYFFKQEIGYIELVNNK